MIQLVTKIYTNYYCDILHPLIKFFTFCNNYSNWFVAILRMSADCMCNVQYLTHSSWHEEPAFSVVAVGLDHTGMIVCLGARPLEQPLYQELGAFLLQAVLDSRQMKQNSTLQRLQMMYLQPCPLCSTTRPQVGQALRQGTSRLLSLMVCASRIEGRRGCSQLGFPHFTEEVSGPPHFLSQFQQNSNSLHFWCEQIGQITRRFVRS